ncbi:MAG: uridylate kinase [Methanocalculus sp. MSAO_Arc1]|uniref:isopentenyl phosphate kinase n=1 Tax=Methanocalculus TaxID=71151 RepID=UPI000FED88A9|nr:MULTISPECIES: isopentenyl phosphate kinase [unclassified Methanocalculus]MCP1662251.1 isopentenyl phosphate kinase [Methanocalculus sp. AMF5]RQD81705.1 MAG: uridylate kinase [Methanocalculus sp. MSAO_Arc1]
MTNTVVLKLGGSVITEKEHAGIIDHGRLRTIAEAIAASRGLPLIIVHGAGSCGHPEAHRFGIQDGVSESNARGVLETHRAVAGLNAAVVSALHDAGIDAIGIHPLSGSYAENGRLISFETGHLGRMAGLGIVPVLHGDVVMDRIRGAAIISGDQLVLHAARGTRAGRVGLATDVPGVLVRDEVVPRLDSGQVETIDLGSSRHTDVTGGMRGKVRELAELAEAGITGSIFHIDRLSDFLAGKPHGGTDIVRAER